MSPVRVQLAVWRRSQVGCLSLLIGLIFAGSGEARASKLRMQEPTLKLAQAFGGGAFGSAPKSKKKKKIVKKTSKKTPKDRSKRKFGVALGIGGGVLGLGYSPGVSLFGNLNKNLQVFSGLSMHSKEDIPLEADSNGIEPTASISGLLWQLGGRYFPIAAWPLYVEGSFSFRRYTVLGLFEKDTHKLDVNWQTEVMGLDLVAGTQWILASGLTLTCGWAGIAQSVSAKTGSENQASNSAGEVSDATAEELKQEAVARFGTFHERMFPLQMLLLANIGWAF